MKLKFHRQVVPIDAYGGHLEVVSFYDKQTQTYGADIFYNDELVESIKSMKTEPTREHLLSIGYNYIITKEKSFKKNS